MAELTPAQRGVPVASLIGSRAVYAYNWYVVGPIQGSIAAGLSVSFGSLSWALWTFLLGVAIFQLPAGVFSLRIGVRPTALAGAAILAAGALGSAAAPDFAAFLASRFVVGAGAALFFSPGIALIARYYAAGGRGWGIGLFNGAFSIGAAVSVVLTVVIAQAWGWRGALLTAGVAMALATAQNLLVLPRLPEVLAPRSAALRRTRQVARSPYLLGLALALVGFWASNFAAAQYAVPWAETVRGLGPTEAGGLDGLLIALPVVGAPLGGALAERAPSPVRLLALSTVLTGLGYAVFPLVPTFALVPLAAATGVAAGMGTGALYYMGTLDARGRGENLPLAVAFINFVQVAAGSFLVLLLGAELFGQGTVAGLNDGFYALSAITIGMVLFLARVQAPAPTEPDGTAPRGPAPSGPPSPG